jgi:N6-L-threonylcarbamoyladenine synthase
LGKLPAQSYERGEGVKTNRSNNIGAVAVTYGPGLSIALEVGIKKAKELAMAWNVPLIAVNHMEGHLYSPFVQNSKGNPRRELQYPFLSLLISGGHTQIVLATENGKYEIVGETVDDSAGEALDKAAKMLGLGYPGGPIIERLASDVDNIDVYKFPRPMMHTQRPQNRVLLVMHPSGGPRHLRKTDFLNASDGHNQCSMSFSGLKTHLYYFLKGEKGQTVDVQQDLKYIASAFQEAVFDSVVRKFERAVNQTGVKHWAVGGGVSINKRLRYLLRSLARKYEADIVFPPYPYLCGDNAAMIGVAAHMQAQRGDFVKDISSLERIPRLKL